ncbi:hypothetical protein LTR08_004090 [Meristemomyces frigidus]|nr:hypothetical protein LTR08_004090 [Meristemomyces frigidus]
MPPPPEALARHRKQVDLIAASVAAFHARGEKFRIFHGSTNSTRASALGRDPKKVVDTSRLNHVLHIDVETMTALVEPNVPMDRLVEATLEVGLVPPVVMEFPGITVGGGFNGTSGESSSFRHGFFNETLNSVEMVLADGSTITCSRESYPDLFHGAAGAVGTFGVTTLVEIQLRKATRYAEVTYHPVSSTAEAISKIKTMADPAGPLDYVDGIMFSPTSGAIITGTMNDRPSPNLPIQRFSAAKDPWFYLHAQARIAQPQSGQPPWSEAVPLPEYLFRYDRGGFWVARAAFAYFPFTPFNRWTRRWLDDFLHTRMLYTALHASGRSRDMIVQDLALPYATAGEFVAFAEARTGIWPLWLCPLRAGGGGESMHPHLRERGGEGEGMLNIGLWGPAPPPLTPEAFVAVNRDIEAKLRELGGMKWLYAQTFSSAREFWRDFDEGWYEGLRRKFGAEGLPSVYEKVRAVEKGRGGEGGVAGWIRWGGGVLAFAGCEGVEGRDWEWGLFEGEGESVAGVGEVGRGGCKGGWL